MADVDITGRNFNVVMRRFGEGLLSGSDLEQIRTALLDLTQEQLGNIWGMSRRQISHMENKKQPDAKTCDAYRGLMVRHFLTGVKGTCSVSTG